MLLVFDQHNPATEEKLLVYINPSYIVSVHKANNPDVTVIDTVCAFEGTSHEWYVKGDLHHNFLYISAGMEK
jgi:hypothetical protein